MEIIDIRYNIRVKYITCAFLSIYKIKFIKIFTINSLVQIASFWNLWKWNCLLCIYFSDSKLWLCKDPSNYVRYKLSLLYIHHGMCPLSFHISVFFSQTAGPIKTNLGRKLVLRWWSSTFYMIFVTFNMAARPIMLSHSHCLKIFK